MTANGDTPRNGENVSEGQTRRQFLGAAAAAATLPAIATTAEADTGQDVDETPADLWEETPDAVMADRRLSGVWSSIDAHKIDEAAALRVAAHPNDLKACMTLWTKVGPFEVATSLSAPEARAVAAALEEAADLWEKNGTGNAGP